MRATARFPGHARQNGGLALRHHDLRKSAVRVAAIKDQDPGGHDQQKHGGKCKKCSPHARLLDANPDDLPDRERSQQIHDDGGVQQLQAGRVGP